jgi:hypothetical protein
MEQQDDYFLRVQSGTWQIKPQDQPGPRLDHTPEDALQCILTRYQEITTGLMQRPDAGAIFGPWLRNLVQWSDRTSSFAADPERSSLAKAVLEQIVTALSKVGCLALERTTQPTATCLVARALANTASSGTYWDEWQDFLCTEDESLRSCDSVSWRAVANTLLCTEDPHTAWLKAARALQPTLRRRTRARSVELNPVVHLIMPGVFASASLRSRGAALWSSVFELARRQFLTDRPNEADGEYRLCSYVFVAFPHISDDRELLERMLDLLPTSAHVDWARAYACPAGADVDQP